MDNDLEIIFMARILAEERLRDKNRERISLGQPGGSPGWLQNLIRVLRA